MKKTNKIIIFSYFILNIISNIAISPSDLMTYEEYKRKRFRIPYKFSLTKKDQCLFYFGANHSCNPKDKQYPQLEKFWNKFIKQTKGKNCIVLVEGRVRKLFKNKEEAIIKGGCEGGFITLLAHQYNINTACPEPHENLMIQQLSKCFSKDLISYTKIAQTILQAIRISKVDKKFNFVDYLKPTIKYYLGNNKTIDDLKILHKTLFNTTFNLKDEKFFYKITNPVIQDTIINQVCRKNSIFRDLNIIKEIEKHICDKKNIFIVFGATHAIMQEKAIRNIWIKI